MKYEIDLPDVPDGCTTPLYRPLYLPIDPGAYVLMGDRWRKADNQIRTGGSFWLVCVKPDSEKEATR
jgi:hypothetical protein